MEEAKKRGDQEGEGGHDGGGGGVFFSAEKEEEEETPEDSGSTSSSGVDPQLQFLDKVVFVVAQRQILMVVQGPDNFNGYGYLYVFCTVPASVSRYKVEEYVLLSGIVVGFARVVAPRVVFPSFVVWPLMFGIMAGMEQNDSCAVGLHVLISTTPVSGSHSCGASLVRLRSTEIGIFL